MVLPPVIFHSFSPDLLSTPAPSFSQNCKTLWRFYLSVKKLQKKCQKIEKRRVKFENLEKIFLELYGRTKDQEEKNIEEDAEGPTKQSLYMFRRSNRNNKGISI